MIKRLSNDCNYSLLLPIFLFYLISVGVQSLAADLDGADVKNVVTKQIVFCLISLAAMGIVSKISTSFLLKYAPVFYVLSLGVMALLYWFYDPAMYAVTGTKRWLRFGGCSAVQLAHVLTDVYAARFWNESGVYRHSGCAVCDFWCSLEDTDDDYWNRCGARRRLAGVGI